MFTFEKRLYRSLKTRREALGSSGQTVAVCGQLYPSVLSQRGRCGIVLLKERKRVTEKRNKAFN